MHKWAIGLGVIGAGAVAVFTLFTLCRILGIWSYLRRCFIRKTEETAHLTKNGHFETNGYLLNSESDIALDVSGNYKHYDNVGNDLKLVQATECEESNNHILSSPPSSTQVIPIEPPQPPPPPPQNGEYDKETLFFEKSEMPTLKRAISCDSISSNSSVMAEALESPHQCGELEIGIEYDNETEDLIVIINRARDLVGVTPNSITDTYVKVFLRPDKSTNMQTRVCRKSNNPVFKERFLFGVDESNITERSLLFIVYGCDKYSNSMLGETEIKLKDLDLSQPHLGWFAINDSNQGPAELGDVMFSLTYLPTAERLTVVVVKARNLRWKKTHSSTEFNPFVKVYLLQNGKKFAKKKTLIKKNERDPIFNEAMIFSVPSQALQNVQIRVTVSDHQPEGKSHSIGHVFVGPFCKGKSLSHWNQMMSSLRKPVAMWHPLRKLSDY